ARLRPGEDVADLTLVLDGGAQRVLDLVAVERVNGLELVERHHEALLAKLRDASGKREDGFGEPRRIARGPHGRKRDRGPRPGIDPQLRPERSEQLTDPGAEAVGSRLRDEQRPGVSLEEPDVRAVAADGDVDGDG